MYAEIPNQIILGLDKILNQLNESKLIKQTKFLIGNPQNAHRMDFDDSGWNISGEPVKYKRDQGITWFRFTAETPEKIMDIPVDGSGIRLVSFFLAPIDTYVNGELKFSEKTWMDFKMPEIILTENAKSGEKYSVAVRMDFGEFCYYSAQFSMNFVIDRVEDMAFEIASFKEELEYACRFKEVKEVLPEVFGLISASLENNEGVLRLVEKIKLSREMLKPMETEAKKNTVHLIGHAHIDMNWFWSMEETLDVVKRDFGTMTQIMEEMPEFRFSQSQCATYEMAQKNYPELFEKMKKHIQAGNWDVTASTWVEGDMNMSSGEAIIRHILYSKKYLKENFGIEPRVMWCPDTFGHSANVPQIAKKGGIDYYFFTRCGNGNQEYGEDILSFYKNGAEKPVFTWEGLDGSRVTAYNMMYNSEMNPTNPINISKKLQDQYGLKNSMYVYGTGDHGGGPTRRDLKRVKQMNSYPTMPKLEFSTSHEFFDKVVSEKSPNLSLEKGELNFVFDGCYTTHADIKKNNRQCENALFSTEILGTIGSMYGLEYKRDEIESSWKKTLFNQFHDIFDGSGVKLTYQYSSETAEEALKTLAVISEESIRKISSMIGVSDKGIPVLVFNTTGWKRSECVKIKKPEVNFKSFTAVDCSGKVLSTQMAEDNIYVFVEDIPAVGYRVIYLREEQNISEYGKIKEKDEFFEIETKYYFIEIKKDSGEITSMYDKTNRRYIVKREEIGWSLKKGILNTLQVHYEVPTPMSSWTIGAAGSIKNLVSGAKATIIEDGLLVKKINFRHIIDNSVISQDIVIYNDSRRIDFITHVDWKEYGDREKEAPMLKACFVPNIDNQYATYEIPCGAVERPCKDMEVPALKWIDISDESYGFSLLNDCKYGHKVKGNSMEITLIRSGWEPDHKSDIGEHDFTYSILPHEGDWKKSGTVEEGYFLNNEVKTEFIQKNGMAVLPEISSYIEIDKANIIMSAFKCAESDNAYILRLYEGTGAASKVKVKLGFPVEKVVEVDSNENKTFSISKFTGNQFEFDMGKFEIKTFKLFIS